MSKTTQELPIDIAIPPAFSADLTFEAIQSRFITAASTIMLEYNLKRDAYCWDVTALELYIYRTGIWEDETTHGFRFKTRRQLELGTWYLHRDGHLPAKRLGIDITVGSQAPELHGGILIAAIGKRGGSGRAVKAIVRGQSDEGDWRYNDREMSLLISEINGKSIDSGAPCLRLVRRSTRKAGPLWLGPRKLSKKVSERFRSAKLRIQHDHLPRLSGWDGLRLADC